MRGIPAFVLLAALLVPAAPAFGQPQTGEDGGECRAGELCGSADFEDAEQRRQKVPDPPGDFVTSLVTLGCIALVVGTYLVSALTGRNPFSRLAARRRTG